MTNMETLQQNRPDIEKPQSTTLPLKESSLCDKLKTTRLMVELGNGYIVWSIYSCSLKKLNLCHSGMITANNMSDPGIVGSYLQNLINQYNLAGAEIDLFLNISDALLRCHYIPAVPKNELEQVVTWESNKIFPFTFDKSYYDWRIAESLEWGGSKKHEIQAAAIPQDRIQPVFDLLQNNSLKINRITYSSLAWEDYLRQNHTAEKSAEGGNLALARLVGNELTILFFHKYFLEFMRENNLEAGSLGGGFEESLRFLNENNDSAVYNNLDVENIKYENIARDINDSLDYYYGQFSQRNIDKILLAFPPVIQNQAVHKIRDLLGVAVESAYTIDEAKSTSNEVPANLFLPSGYIGNKKSRSLNLLPQSYRKLQTEKKRFRMSLFAAGIILLLIVGVSFFQQWQIKTESYTAQNLQSNLDQLMSSPAYAKIQALRAVEQNFLTQVNSIDSKSKRVVEFLKALSNLTPSDIRLMYIDLYQNINSETGNYYIDLQGFTRADGGFPEVRLAGFIKALRQIEFIANVKLQNQEMVLQSGGKRLTFNLELELE